MKLFLAWNSSLLLGLTASAAARESLPSNDADILPALSLGDLHTNTSLKHPHQDWPRATHKYTEQQRNDIWCKAVDKGRLMSEAAILDEMEARALLSWPYVQSPWDGDLREELRTWGYQDDEETHQQADFMCDFKIMHGMEHTFEQMHIDPRSVGDGGPNRCYELRHQDGPAVLRLEDGELPFIRDQVYMVDGRTYRVSPPRTFSLHTTDSAHQSTGAYAIIGINAKDGIVFLLNRSSPEKAAVNTWAPDPVTPQALPKLRSSSDLVYGLWHRETTETNRRDIKMFMAVTIVNTESIVIISRALKLEDPEGVHDVPIWPGKTLTMGYVDGGEDQSEATFALLGMIFSHSASRSWNTCSQIFSLTLTGSPNGLAVGYFLAQHKQQLGGTKFVWKVRVFRDKMSWTPNLLFYIDTGSPPVKRHGEMHEGSLKMSRKRRGRKHR